jgi:Dihydroxyacid dehydratase/phosphogluconate dehydratase
MSANTPYITKLNPGGTQHIQDLNEAGGILRELSRLGRMHGDALTVTGTVGDRISIDIPGRQFEIKVSDEEMMKRKNLSICGKQTVSLFSQS